MQFRRIFLCRRQIFDLDAAHRSDYDRILFNGCTSSLKDLACGRDLMTENLYRMSREDSELWLLRKLGAFRSFVSSRTLLILDQEDVSEKGGEVFRMHPVIRDVVVHMKSRDLKGQL